MNKRPIEFRFWCEAGKAFVQNYKFNGFLNELFDQEDFLLTPTQFTGCYDVDRKKIFEGDILEIQRSASDDMTKKYTQIGIVDFSTGSFLFAPDGKDHEDCYTYINFRELFKYSKNHLAYFAPRVIGNIFENKELLNNE